MHYWSKLFFTILLLLGFVNLTYGQYQNFSQFNFSPDRINPGKFLKKDEASIRTVYRTVNSSLNLNLNTIYASGTYPLSMVSSETSWGSVTFSVFNDATNQSGLFNSTELNLGYTHTLQIGEMQTLSFGISVRHNNRGINLRNYTTGSQFNPSLGFDPSIGLGENFNEFESRYYSVSTGIYLKGTDLLNKKYFMGISAYDINRPNESVLNGESAVPLTFQAEGGYHIYEQGQYGIIPSFLYTRSGGTDVLNIGSAFQFKPDDFKTVELHTRYRVAKAIILGMQYHTPNFSVGFSYDLSTGVRNDVFNNALEIGLELRKGILSKKKVKKEKEKKIKRRKNKKEKKHKRKKKRNKKEKKEDDKPRKELSKINPPKLSNTTLETDKDTLESIEPSVVEKIFPTDTVAKYLDKDVSIKVGQLENNKRAFSENKLEVYFDFNSTKLNTQSRNRLTNWVKNLKNHQFLKVIIIGHTDNVGSKEINQQISIKRANTIKEYLIAQGISPNLMAVKGVGMFQPAYENNNGVGRSKNRRVDLIMISTKTN